MRYSITSSCKNLSMNWIKSFPMVKMEFQVHCKFCTYLRIFDLRKAFFSPPLKHRILFSKKCFSRGTNVFGQICEGLFCMGGGGDECEKYPLHTISLALGISCKICLFFNIFSADLHFDALIIWLC